MIKSLFNKTVPVAAAALLVAPGAWAGHEQPGPEFARVVGTTPIYREVRIDEPQQECWDERVVHRDGRYRDNVAAGTVIGAVAGGVAGHQFGKGRGRDAATVLGVLIGANIGQNTAVAHMPPPEEQVAYEQRCRTVTQTRYEQRVDGYDVAYRYAGRIYHTQMPYDPGNRIRVHVDVRPVGY